MKDHNSKTVRLTRRDFLAAGAGAAAGASVLTIVPSNVMGAKKDAKAPSDKLNVAGIGVGGMGGGNMRQCRGENVVALCDVDSKHAARTFKAFPKAKTYKDFRIMLEKQKDIDAVVIATPDHTHAVTSMAAMQLGKHVFCQKPLAHTVYEARMLKEAARKYKVQTQMGNQGHSSEAIRLLKEWIAAGAIGDVTEVHAWSDRPTGGPWYANFAVRDLPKGSPPVPDTLDWDLWLGPTKKRAYHPAFHPFKWRAWLAYGTGALGDMGCHILDPAFWALNLGYPTSVQSEVKHHKPELADQAFPISSTLTYQFPARGKMPPLKLVWTDGEYKTPRPRELEKGRRIDASGAFIYGSKGAIKHGSHGASGMRIFPETKQKEYDPKRPPKTIPRVKNGHMGDWLRACKDGKPASSNFEYGGALTEMVLLGVLAMRFSGQKLEFDSKTMKFTNFPKANELLHIEYRDGWTL
ncbi:MAG: Gfo/Idh/MocA family oxidoreductase [Phycisphaerae bacterium]|jgi:predicted dehydrogenase|nr:Gfo/Idh/MocA family oxidoreductase [Phycisphaerae bacterium]